MKTNHARLLSQAIKKYYNGSVSNFARITGHHRTTVYWWRRTGRVPRAVRERIARDSGGALPLDRWTSL